MALLLASCTEDDGFRIREGAVGYANIRIGVSDMDMNAVTRANAPMSPDVEKYVRTIALFEFDNEGLHDKRATTYHFIDFVEGTVDGKSNDVLKKTDWGIVETTLENIPLEDRSDGTVCLVANVDEVQVDSLYDKYREKDQSYGRLTLDKFKEWALPFDYETMVDGKYDETTAGHIKTMYMFGYYQGPISSSAPELISVDLGRLASRLDITIVNATGQDIEERLGYHFDNVCHSAYFFPIRTSMPPTLGRGISRTVICSGIGNRTGLEDAVTEVPETFPKGSSHTRYFYVAAHSAKNISEATQLHLFWNSSVLASDVVEEGGLDYKVPMCNVHPSHAASVPNGYSLSRNTRYHFTIRLVSASAETKSRSSVQADGLGVYTVALPL